jgi:hypothetical protein
MSWAELGDKFRDCAALVLPDKNAEDIVELVARVEELKSLAPLIRALTGARGKNVKKAEMKKAGSKKWSRTRRA